VINCCVAENIPEELIQRNAMVTDSCLTDMASCAYLEPIAIYEGEADDIGESSMEGSIVDTDYVDRLVVKTSNNHDCH